jgi:hypothetical protein
MTVLLVSPNIVSRIHQFAIFSVHYYERQKFSPLHLSRQILFILTLRSLDMLEKLRAHLISKLWPQRRRYMFRESSTSSSTMMPTITRVSTQTAFLFGIITLFSIFSIQSYLITFFIPEEVALASPFGIAQQYRAEGVTTRTTSGYKYDVCFVTALYSKSVETADRLLDVQRWHAHYPNFGFFAFTNLQDMNMRGWTQILKTDLPYRRFITHSRWPKFMGWTLPIIQDECQAVFYMDGICSPRLGAGPLLERAAQEIADSEVGLMQYAHVKGGGAVAEFQRVLNVKKDLPDNVIASLQWLNSQSDFRSNCTLYENRIFGYNPRSPTFQKAAQFLWDHYSLEQDSWRDQPLWCYVLDHFHITPNQLDVDGLFKWDPSRMGHAAHHYGFETDTAALVSNKK